MAGISNLRKKIIKFSYLSLFSLLTLCFSHVRIAECQDNDRTVVCGAHHYPPWQIYNSKNGKLAGVNVDIARYIFNKMGLKVKFIHQPWTRAWKTIKKGGFDCYFSASRKKPRMKYLYYPEENTWISEFVFFVHRDDKKSDVAGTFRDIIIDGGKIGIVNQYSYDKRFWKAFPYLDGEKKYNAEKRNLHAQLEGVTFPQLNMRKLARKRIKFVIADKQVGLYMIRNEGLQDKITHYNYVLFSKGYPISFLKKSRHPDIKALSLQFEKELIKMKKNGTYDKILKKWIR